ncbi:MAG: hypothetical protein EXS68_01435 [Candidatus Ryanbacteria bacterium]|nr:hypothetical protein [Candidatus Ryanbacteria bacterium]
MNEDAFKNNFLANTAPFNTIAVEERYKYLPKALDPADFPAFPYDDARLDNIVETIYGSAVASGDFSGCATPPGAVISYPASGKTYTVSASVTWPQKVCVNGNLVIKDAQITLNGGAHVYVTGNLQLIKVPNGIAGRIRMQDSGANGWSDNKAGFVMVNGIIDTEATSQFKGGNTSQGEFLFVVSRADKKGEEDPLDANGNTIHSGDQASIYLYSREDGGSPASYYAPKGTIVMERTGSNSADAMQVAAYKVIMQRSSTIEYNYGVQYIELPDGPAQTLGVGDYDEVAP